MIDYLLCADWSKHQKGRALYAADVRERQVFRIHGAALTVCSALEKARELAGRNDVLLSFDVPLGVPHSFLSAIRRTAHWQAASNFLEFLLIAARTPSFFVSGRNSGDWNLCKPFFDVPPGPGGRTAFDVKAQGEGIKLLRAIERETRGNPVFITSGIPGSVGSGAIDAWKELGVLLPLERDFKVWPFEGTFPGLFASSRIVVAENYPRAAYAAALSEYPSHQRFLTSVAKTRPEIRKSAVDKLASLSWIKKYGVALQNTGDALADENAFDALLTTAGLLRVLLEEEPLFSPEFVDSVAEGGILGTGTINFDRAPKLSAGVGAPVQEIPAVSIQHVYACPIPKCSKRFIGSRGGWDGHAGSLKNHTDWHPEITSHKDRVKLFRSEFPLFFTQSLVE